MVLPSVSSAVRSFVTAIVVLWFLSSGQPLTAQPRRDGRLLVTVVDQTGAVIPAATVTVIGEESATRASAVPPVKSSDQGLAAVAGLAPGRYTVQAEFPGFETRSVKDVRVRTGDNRQTLVLAIGKLQDEITVGRDPQEAAADPRSRTFGSALTREQIDALSEDPEEAKRQLLDLAGPGATIRVDSFEGGALPPKSQIKSIHITRDSFAAENHNAGGIFIEIITQPGSGSLRGGGNFRLRDGSMSGRSPFTPTKGSERIQNYGANFGGSIVPQKSSFSLSLNGMTSYDTPNLNVALPGGRRSEALTLTTPRDNVNLSALFDAAITRDQTLRVTYSQNRNTAGNLGIGAYDLPERGFSTRDSSHTFRIQEAGPVGRRFFLNTRVSLNWIHSEQHSALEAPTIRVNDAFTSGGAQTAGGRDSKQFNVASDLDYVRGIHSVRAGLALDGGWWQSDSTSNYLGTYTFESLAAYQAGQPRSYTRRIGDPNVEYVDTRGGIYIQDDIRVKKNLTLSPGLRYEMQVHMHEIGNVGPRFGVTWAPFKSGKTSLRASAGIFYDWLSQNTYEQTLRVDGFRQQELNIVDPGYPEPGNAGIVPPVNRYLLAGDLQMPRTTRLSAGVEQAFSQKLRVGVQYNDMRGVELWRGLNLNAPVDGIRPSPLFGNIVEVVSNASSRQQTVNVNFSVSLAPPSRLPSSSAPRIDWKRISFSGNYTAGTLRNNTDGEFSVSPSGNLSTEWGPTGGDVRHRANVSLSAGVLKNFNASLGLNATSGSPYTIRTGRDENGDLIFNDRPDGVGRNSARGDAQWTLNGTFVYTLSVGKRGGTSTGIRINDARGAINVETVTIEQPRFRAQLYVQAQNLTDHANLAGYQGGMLSPFFGQPTMVTNPRKIDMGISFNF